MPLLSFIFNNSGLVGSITGLAAVMSFGGVIFTVNLEGRESHLFREVPEGEKDKWVEAMDGRDFHEIERVKHSYRDLLNGTRLYNNGNYVIYYGSEACPHCTGMLFGNLNLSGGNLDLKRDKMSDGAWMKAYHFTRADEQLKEKKIKFIMFEDIPDTRTPNYGDRHWTLPWAQDDGGKFIRNDRSSLDFRKVFGAARDRFGDKVPGTPTVIIYREGVPKVFNHDKLPGLETIKQDDSLSNVIELKKFIKYYYVSLEAKQ